MFMELFIITMLSEIDIRRISRKYMFFEIGISVGLCDLASRLRKLFGDNR